MNLRSVALDHVIAIDPRLSLEHLLTCLGRATDADVVGLFLARGDVELLAGNGIDQDALDRVRTSWLDEEDQLRGGRPRLEPLWNVWPLASEGAIALVYVASGLPLSITDVREGMKSLGDLIQRAAAMQLARARPEPAQIDSWLVSSSEQTIERRRLIALLGSNEWNIARVARVMGVTRRTVYYQLKRLGIPRLRLRLTDPQ